MRKKLLSLLTAGIVGMVVLTGCGKQGTKDDDNTGKGNTSSYVTVKVGASPSPHAEILEQAIEPMKELGYQLDIIEYTDYVQPNLALNYGDIDANYFQHKPYLDNFNEERATDLVSAANIHYEPFGIYAGRTSSIEELAEGASIAVPNDGTNEARALMLLEELGLIKLDEAAGFNATVLDIVDNPKKLKIREIEAAQLVRLLPDVDMAVINGNYALQEGLKASEDALAIESQDSAAEYGNIIAVKNGDENNEGVLALIRILQSEEIENYIEETYEGNVVRIEE